MRIAQPRRLASRALVRCPLVPRLVAVLVSGLVAAVPGVWAGEADDMDKAVQRLVKLAEQANGSGRDQAPPVTKPATPPEVPPVSATPAPVPVTKINLAEDFWGVDLGEGAFDLRFSPANGGEDAGTLLIYRRAIQAGTHMVVGEDITKAKWKRESIAGTNQVTIDGDDLGLGTYQLDDGQLKLIAGSGMFTTERLVKRPLKPGDMGSKGRQAFAP